MGDTSSLKEIAKKYGLKFSCVNQLIFSGAKLSSSSIRELLTDGELERATEILGHNFTVTGTVKHGKRLATENNVTIFTALDTVRVLLDVLEETTLTISTIDA